MRPVGQERSTDSRRRAKQVDQEPGVTPEIADEVEVSASGRIVLEGFTPCPGDDRPQRVRHREVVVDARNCLHDPTIAIAEPPPIDRLDATDMGLPVAAQRDSVIGGKRTRHTGGPQQLVLQVSKDEAMDIVQFRDARGGAFVHTRDQFRLRLAEIRRDMRVGERCAQRGRMRRPRECPARGHPQALFFDAAPQAREFLSAPQTPDRVGAYHIVTLTVGVRRPSVPRPRSTDRRRTSESCRRIFRSGLPRPHRTRTCPPTCSGDSGARRRHRAP